MIRALGPGWSAFSWPLCLKYFSFSTIVPNSRPLASVTSIPRESPAPSRVPAPAGAPVLDYSCARGRRAPEGREGLLFLLLSSTGASPRSWKTFPAKQGCLTQDARLVNWLRSVQMKPSLTSEAPGGLNSWGGFSSSSLCCPHLPFQFYSQRLPHTHPVLSPSLRPNRPIFMTVLMASLPWASSPDGPALGSKHQGPAPPSS